jgi:hypothetical protein
VTAPTLNQSPRSPGASGKGELSCPHLLEPRRVCSEKAEEWRFLSVGEAAPKLSLITARQRTNQELSGRNLKVKCGSSARGSRSGLDKAAGCGLVFRGAVTNIVILQCVSIGRTLSNESAEEVIPSVVAGARNHRNRH